MLNVTRRGAPDLGWPRKVLVVCCEKSVIVTSRLPKDVTLRDTGMGPYVRYHAHYPDRMQGHLHAHLHVHGDGSATRSFRHNLAGRRRRHPR
jgi:hypothetical protein